MNFPLLLPLIVTAALAVAGWYAVHRLSHEFAVSMAKDQAASLDSLVADIRSELRRELRLEPLPDRIVVFRQESKTR
ncbi:MAG: hypothetical protein ACHP9V_02765 [Terriglobales bacterium]